MSNKATYKVQMNAYIIPCKHYFMCRSPKYCNSNLFRERRGFQCKGEVYFCIGNISPNIYNTAWETAKIKLSLNEEKLKKITMLLRSLFFCQPYPEYRGIRSKRLFYRPLNSQCNSVVCSYKNETSLVYSFSEKVAAKGNSLKTTW